MKIDYENANYEIRYISNNKTYSFCYVEYLETCLEVIKEYMNTEVADLWYIYDIKNDKYYSYGDVIELLEK